MVQINKTGERVEVTREYEVTDAEPIQIRHRQQLFIPQSVRVRFVDGKWVKLFISGGTARNDGTPGMRRHENDYVPPTQWHGDADKLPEWAVPLTQFEED